VTAGRRLQDLHWFASPSGDEQMLQGLDRIFNAHDLKDF
jgi:hypothetical protein